MQFGFDVRGVSIACGRQMRPRGFEKRGLIDGKWVERSGQRRRRYYRLTARGRQVLAAQRRQWTAFVQAMTRVASVQRA